MSTWSPWINITLAIMLPIKTDRTVSQEPQCARFCHTYTCLSVGLKHIDHTMHFTRFCHCRNAEFKVS